MVAKKYRFHGYHKLQTLFSRSQTIRSDGFNLCYLFNNRPHYRAAVVVSKKVSKKAVVRNRLRRRFYELIRCELVDNQGLDLAVIVFNADLASYPAQKLRQVFVESLTKIPDLKRIC